MFFAYIFIFLVFIIGALFCLCVSAEIYYEYINKVQKAEITIRLFKIIKIKIPVKLNKEKKSDEKKASAEKESFSLEKIKNIFSRVTDALSNAKSDIYALFSSISKHLVIKKVLFETEYGLSDAAKTGMSYGAVWGVVSCALSAIDNFSEIKDLELNIYPVFDRECFNLRTNCIISIKIAHIISIGIKILKIINCFSKIITKEESK